MAGFKLRLAADFFLAVGAAMSAFLNSRDDAFVGGIATTVLASGTRPLPEPAPPRPEAMARVKQAEPASRFETLLRLKTENKA